MISTTTPANILTLSPKRPLINVVENARIPNVWKRALKATKKSQAHLLLTTTSVKEITSFREEISFINEGDTIQHILNQLTTNKSNYAIVVDNSNKPIGIFDVETLFGYCNDKISHHKIPFEALLEKLEEIKLELSAAKLNQIFQYSYQSKRHWQIRSIPASRPIMHLLHIMCANPGLRKVPVLDEKGNVQGIVEISNALRFILENDEEFSDLTKRPISDLPFTRKSLPAMKASRDQLMASEFKLMWQKHVDGHLGCCNRSSSLDLFFNYVHHVLLGFQTFAGENEPVGQIEITRSIEELLDLVSRENLDSVYIIAKDPKRIVGVLSVAQLLSYFCE